MHLRQGMPNSLPSGELMSCVLDVVVKSSSKCCGDMERIWWDRGERDRIEIQEKENQGCWCYIGIELAQIWSSWLEF